MLGYVYSGHEFVSEYRKIISIIYSFWNIYDNLKVFGSRYFLSFFLSYFFFEFHDSDAPRRQSADFEFVRTDSAKIGYVRFAILLLKVTERDRVINVEPKLSYFLPILPEFFRFSDSRY